MGSLPIFYLWRRMDMADLAGLIEQAVGGLGYELVDFEASPRARLLRIFIDRLPQAGVDSMLSSITVDDCATVSHHLARLFTVENIDYDRLEVSSPGIDRPLKKQADFERFAGQDVQIKLRVPQGAVTGGAAGPQRNFSGRILGVTEEAVRIQTAEAEHEFAFDNIEKARLVPKF
jgi:ribosome maturation factor RimP